MKKILITGGAGFFGTLLKKRLLEKENYMCVSIDLEKDTYKHENLISIQGDITDKKILEEIFENHKFDAIFHCAAILAHDKRNIKKLWNSNVLGTEIISEFAIKYNVKKIVFISSNCLWGKNFENLVTEEEIPDPIEIYGKSKLEAEKILISKKDKINSIIFRSPTIIDEGRLGLLSMLFEFIDENRKIPMVGDGNNRYQFIYAQDFIEAFLASLDYNKTEIFNIGSDNVKTFNDVYKYVIDKSNSKSKLLHFPKIFMIMAMKICYLLRISPLGPYQYKMISSSFIFDTTKIKKELNFKPTLTNEEMLLKAYNFFHTNRKEISNRKDVSAHNQNAKMGIIKVLKWFL